MNALFQTLSASTFREVWKAKCRKLRKTCFGVDRVSARTYETRLKFEFFDARQRVQSGFSPDGLLAIAKKKPHSTKYRIICVPTVRDRMIQFAVLETLKPKQQAMGIDNSISYGIVEGTDKGVQGARRFACNARREKPWVYKTDIQQFFDNIDRELLVRNLAKICKQSSLLPVLQAFMQTEITSGFDPNWKEISRNNGILPGRGIRQGMPLSPFFAACYLRDFDRRLIATKTPLARYVDDIIAFFETEKEATSFHKVMRSALSELGLQIGDIDAPNSKTCIYAPHEPAPFLGLEMSISPNGSYKLFISKDCITDSVQSISNLGKIDELLKLDIDLTGFGRFLDAKINGYIHAYSEAYNKDPFRDALITAGQQAKRIILEDLFGKDRLRELKKPQLQFIGIT